MFEYSSSLFNLFIKSFFMADRGGLIQWQAQLGMGMVGVGSIGLFLSSRGSIPNEGMLPFGLILTALLGALMLFLSVGVENTNSDLAQTTQLVPDELVEVVEKVIGMEEE